MGLRTLLRSFEFYFIIILLGLMVFMNRDLTVDVISQMINETPQEAFYRLTYITGTVLISGLLLFKLYREKDLKDIENNRQSDKTEYNTKFTAITTTVTDTNEKIAAIYESQIKNEADDKVVKGRIDTMLEKIEESISINEKITQLWEKKIDDVEKKQEKMQNNHEKLEERVSKLEKMRN